MLHSNKISNSIYNAIPEASNYREHLGRPATATYLKFLSFWRNSLQGNSQRGFLSGPYSSWWWAAPRKTSDPHNWVRFGFLKSIGNMRCNPWLKVEEKSFHFQFAFRFFRGTLVTWDGSRGSERSEIASVLSGFFSKDIGNMTERESKRFEMNPISLVSFDWPSHRNRNVTHTKLVFRPSYSKYQ